MKNINDLTIKQFEDFTEMMSMEEPDIFSIFELFDLDAQKMKFDEFQKKWDEIQKMKLNTKGTQKIYIIGNRHFKACLNPLKLTAGQFIDFQTYVSNGFKLHQILSVFLIPQTKTWFFGKYKTKKYNIDYDIFELQEYLYNNMKIGDANNLSNFFLTWSIKLLETMKGFSEKKLYKMKMEEMKKINSFG